MKSLLMAALLVCSTAALANSACDKPKNDFDGLYCLNKVYQQADKDLGTTYGELHNRLDADGKKMLKTGELAWMRERNGNCSYSDQRGFYVNLDCATRMTTDRLQFLQARLRECQSAGCMNSKLQ
ncbi:lysozyme inhibitor LprI family protein [Paludibacterium purpuratum]|uniref:Uncharacterized protein YecT (DUF1311 family) n=1 Tax=Paludibacterium purpuratum TaxID=1144873 RepID=A0A4R7BGK3_9NEIS|nr:lysozyme inhibitor LprI family protein [Paludibacterium purpuratum]TDR82856.1 uncharacterized protein YecT (DUF1311 family) [Paludibacterium purpuratum]